MATEKSTELHESDEDAFPYTLLRHPDGDDGRGQTAYAIFAAAD